MTRIIFKSFQFIQGQALSLSKFQIYELIIGLTLISIPISTSAGGLFSSLLGAIAFYEIIVGKFYKKLELSHSWYLILIFAFITMLSVFYNWGDLATPWKNLKEPRYLIFAALITLWLKGSSEYFLSQDRIVKYVKIYVYGYLIASAYSLICRLRGYDLIKNFKVEDARLYGFTGIMSYCYEIAIVALFSISLFIYKPDIFKKNKFLFISSFTILLGLIFSGTRGGILAFLLSSPFIFLHRSKKIVARVMCGSVICLSILLLIIKYQVIPNRFFQKFDSQSNQVRLSFYKTSLLAFADKPILGHGIMSLKSKYQALAMNNKYEWTLEDVHNTYFQVLVDTGIFGFLSFMLFLFFWLKELWQRHDLITYVTLAPVIAFLVENLYYTQLVSGSNTAINILLYYVASQMPPIDASKRY